eukprot:TRINITY_DN11194_c0_g1_i1.p1 TRINITY_DN11194_c0_g1~~TRINITY_DN11194_c0_g1_i1.p1  ORF type:complete len:306 (-),score=68.23 TRINITY_DN11194_c0_g1_i1:222-1139(-)
MCIRDRVSTQSTGPGFFAMAVSVIVILASLVGLTRGYECPSVPDSPLNCTAGSPLNTACFASLDSLKPTQMSVGMILMECKLKKYENKSPKKMNKYINRHPIPTALGPNDSFFITDHHHYATAMTKSSYSHLQVLLCPYVDLRNTSTSQFWNDMKAENMAWPYDRRGNILTGDTWYEKLPSSLHEMHDDPFRSLSGWVRDDQGYIKCSPDLGYAQCSEGGEPIQPPPFLEYMWANIFRVSPPLAVNVYSMNAYAQVQPLWGIVKDMISLAQAANYSSMPGFNQDPVHQYPKHMVEIDNDGCELDP